MKKLLISFFVLSFLHEATSSPDGLGARKRDLSKYRSKKPLLKVGARPPVATEETWNFEKPAVLKDFSDVCGFAGPGTPNTGNRIVGGEEATPNEWPWQVAIFIDDLYFCGGSLISDEWVMTAAHCTTGASSFNIILGAHNIDDYTEDGHYEVYSSEYIIHPGWDSELIRNDISLIRLPQPIVITNATRPVCLPTIADATTDWVSQYVTPTGWGLASDLDIAITNKLRKVTTRAMRNEDCDAVYGIITPQMICIDTYQGRGTCSGDSGGPLNKVRDDGRYRTLGIVSFGAADGCELGFPDGFTRVTSFLDWIQAQTGIAYQ